MCTIITTLSAETDRWMREQGFAKDIYPYEWDRHFAELVVKECLKECWYDKTPLEISNAIRAKFGMELVGE